MVPKNIKIEILPPYYPELNPVERFWQCIKNHTIKNMVFGSLEEIENAVCDFVNNLPEDVVIGICNKGS